MHILAAMAAPAFGVLAVVFVNRHIHRIFGGISAAAVLLLVASGALMFLDAEFRAALTQMISRPGTAHDIFQDELFLDLSFVVGSLMPANMTITGLRLWTRVRRSRGGRLFSNWFDWTVTFVTIPIYGVFVIVALQHVLHGSPAAILLASIGVTGLVFQINDLSLLLRPPMVSEKKWWMIHMGKMLGAITAIIQAQAVLHAANLPLLLVILIAVGTLPALMVIGQWNYHCQRTARQRPRAPSAVGQDPSSCVERPTQQVREQ
ncbi:MAG: hypothetical protein ROR55_21425 [Devosia sp.]